MHLALEAVWNHLLPAMGTVPLADNVIGRTALVQRLATLTIPAPRGAGPSRFAGQISRRSFAIEPNELKLDTAAFDFSDNAGTLEMSGPAGTHRVHFGLECWRIEDSVFFAKEPGRVAAAGMWPSAEVFILNVRPLATAYCWTITTRFTGNRIIISSIQNVSFGQKAGPTLAGTMQ